MAALNDLEVMSADFTGAPLAWKRYTRDVSWNSELSILERE